MQNITLIPIEKLYPHPDNPRKNIGDVTELAESIKARGIMQNLTVVPRDGNDSYTVIIGHRRMAAAKEAGLTELPCIIAEMDQREQVTTMLLENMQRSDLTVYEQAQGFQMMLDLGSSVEEISQKSGFSTTTVRRRVKMMELNQDVLKEVSERQLSLFDFDELAKIEDINARNKCLKEIGTPNFKQSVASVIRQQEIKKKLPSVKKLMKDAKAIAIKQSDTWSSEYEFITDNIYIAECDEISPLIPKKPTEQVYYYLDELNGRIRLYKKHKKAKPVKKSPEELERAKRIEDTKAALEEKTAVAYNLRVSFIKNISYTKKNAEAILNGALIAGVLKAINYMGPDRNTIGELLGMDMSVYESDRGFKTIAALQELDKQKIPTIIYAMFGDYAKSGFSTSYTGRFPEYKPSADLNGLYMWLTSLGYEMSDEEKALQDGTHALYHLDEKEGTK